MATRRPPSSLFKQGRWMTTTHTLAGRTTCVILTAVISALLALQGAAAPGDETTWTRAFETAKQRVPGFRVESTQAFRTLNEHHQRLLSDGITVNSFELPTGDQIRCVDIYSQRSVGASGQPLQTAPGVPPADDVVTAPNPQEQSVTSIGISFGLDGTLDTAGNVRACPVGSFPRLIPRLENMYHFRTLDEFFQKAPGGVGTPGADLKATVTEASPLLSTVEHEYAHAYDWVDNIGMRADFNLWSPTVAVPGEFSLSQLWVARGLKADNSVQTAETGWQEYPAKYGNSKSRLFIYYTSANYQAGTGCYNLDCTAFVQTDSSVMIGGSFSAYSTIGGTQEWIALAFYRDPASPHNWWLKFNDTWVGYYPNSLFNSQGLANYTDHVDFGGEIVNTADGGQHTTTDMGSGRFPYEGLGAAAFIRKIQYWDMSGSLRDATGLTRTVTNSSYYDLSLYWSNDSSWRQHFFFGGPGRIASSPPTANFNVSANPKSGQPVLFTDTSTGSPTSWSWVFGDGGTSTIQNATHTFGAGTYQVSLTAWNAVGSSTKTQTVVVSSGGGATCAANATTMCLIGGRYRVTSYWKNQYAGGATATLNKTTLTAATGAFWLADSNTYEYLIRINTATDNGKAWIAIPTFTDVEFFVLVEDLVGGQSKTYRNPPYSKTLIYDPSFFVYP